MPEPILAELRPAMTEPQKAQPKTIGESAKEEYERDRSFSGFEPWSVITGGIWDEVALAAVRHALAQLAPEWKLVPKIPTEEMIRAAYTDKDYSYAVWRWLYDVAPEPNLEDLLGGKP